MSRPVAPVGRARVVAPARGLVSMLVLGLLLALTGCGSAAEQETDEPSSATLSCRKDWKGLEEKVEDRNALTNPSALAPRWNTIAATIDYYSTSASSKDCGKTMADQEKAMADLSTFATKLAPYDMELRLVQVQSDAEVYAAGPRLPAPKPSPTKKGKKKKKQRPPAPPTPAMVAAALKTLDEQAPVATQQQGPGWQQAHVADLADTAAVAKTVKDLAFLSSESPAFNACSQALAQIRKALTAAAK